MAPRWPQGGQEEPQGDTTTAQESPREPKMAPRWPQGGPRCPQDGPKMAPKLCSRLGAVHIFENWPTGNQYFCFWTAVWLQAAPREPKMAPRWPQDGPRWPREAPRGPQEAPRRLGKSPCKVPRIGWRRTKGKVEILLGGSTNKLRMGIMSSQKGRPKPTISLGRSLKNRK